MISTSNDLHVIHRELAIITEAFESLEEIASQHEVQSSQVGKIMVPLCLNLESITNKLHIIQPNVSFFSGASALSDSLQKNSE